MGVEVMLNCKEKISKRAKRDKLSLTVEMNAVISKYKTI
jgi:hypothetical protein